jgi:hypothetical protein
MTVHELLVDGRNRLAAGHHLKGELEDGRGGYCALGALMVDYDVDSTKHYTAAIGALDTACGQDVVHYNNAPETTKDDVLGVFDKAIAQTAPEPDTSFLTLPERETV